MRILRLYVLRELVGPFLIALFVFSFLLLLNRMFQLFDLLLGYGVEMALVGKLLFYLIPSLFTITLPMAILAATLIGLGRLAADRELLAMVTSGINPMRVFTPCIFVAVLLSAFSLWANFTLFPHLMLRTTDVIYQIEFKVLTSLRPARFYDELSRGPLDFVLYFAHRGEEPGEMRNLSMKVRTQTQEKDPETLTTQQKIDEFILVASKGFIRAKPMAKAIELELVDGTIYPLGDEQADTQHVIHFGRISRNITPEFGRFEEGRYIKREREMNLRELLDRMANDPKRSRANEARSKLYEHISLGFSPLVFVLLGIPLAVYIRPGGKSTGFLISFGLTLVYFALLKWGSSMVEGGATTSPIPVLLPNILLSILAVALIIREVNR